MSKTLILIPTYNESENAPQLARAIAELMPKADLMFLDDHSPDGTGEALERLRTELPRVHVMHRPEKNGLGRAYLDGFRWSLSQGYETTVCMDADLSHDPADIPRLLSTTETTDLVCGSRYVSGGGVVNWPKSRLCLSRFAAWYVRVITGLPHKDPTGGFHAIRREAIAALPLDEIRSDGYSFQIELKHRLWMLGFTWRELPITFTERQNGVSKMSGGIVREAVGIVWRIAWQSRFRRKPAPERKVHS
ncbi:MAG: polyprenol monophosphomannose synthase [Verrucomicrobia bacterium]|nr:polyprenol monophosphomannose synthase [Verrucomicrobiota bacterium]MCH8511455.1 polyprenol monophosphomannose synthase [Kiritimatiellia bacterium]